MSPKEAVRLIKYIKQALDMGYEVTLRRVRKKK